MARPRQISDEQILETTRRLVLSRGPHVSLDTVAADLGVTGPALLKRFGTREALLIAALVPPPNPEWIEVVRAGPDGTPLESQLLDIFTRIAAFMKGVVPCMSALRESGIPMDRVFAQGKFPQEGVQSLVSWLTRARDKGIVEVADPETAAFVMFGPLQMRSFHNHFLQRTSSPKAERESLCELARFMSRALAPRRVRKASSPPSPRR